MVNQREVIEEVTGATDWVGFLVGTERHRTGGGKKTGTKLLAKKCMPYRESALEWRPAPAEGRQNGLLGRETQGELNLVLLGNVPGGIGSDTVVLPGWRGVLQTESKNRPRWRGAEHERVSTGNSNSTGIFGLLWRGPSHKKQQKRGGGLKNRVKYSRSFPTLGVPWFEGTSEYTKRKNSK